jgi:hypothetical protein
MDLPDWVERRSLALGQPCDDRPWMSPGGRGPRLAACEGDHRRSAISPFTRMVSGSVSVVLAATTFVNDRYKPGWSASLQCSGGWMFHLIGVMLAPG